MKLADAQTQIEKLIERGEPFERVETAIERLDRPDAEKAALWLLAWSAQERRAPNPPRHPQARADARPAGHTQDVLNTRQQFQAVMQPEAVKLVEGLTGRRVIGFMSENHIDPDLGAEVFVVEPADEPGQLEEPESTGAQG